MGCCASANSRPSQHVKTTAVRTQPVPVHPSVAIPKPQQPVVQQLQQPSHFPYEKQYISPPSVIIPSQSPPVSPMRPPPLETLKKTAPSMPAVAPVSVPVPRAPVQVPIPSTDDYPDMNSYGNGKATYLEAAAKQTTDILHDEDYGAFGGTGRNVSMRVDMYN